MAETTLHLEVRVAVAIVSDSENTGISVARVYSPRFEIETANMAPHNKTRRPVKISGN